MQFGELEGDLIPRVFTVVVIVQSVLKLMVPLVQLVMWPPADVTHIRNQTQLPPLKT